MRVCFVTLDFPPYRSSGLTIYVETLVRGLSERGHHITVIAAARPETRFVTDDIPIPQTVRILRFPVGPFDWLGIGWQAARYLNLRYSEFDIIHFADVHFAYAYRRSFVASAFQSFRQRRTSHHGGPYHTGQWDCLFRWIYYNLAQRLMEQPSIKRANHLIMSSLATLQEFVEHYNVNPDRTTLIYPGIDLSRFEKLPRKSVARQNLALPIDKPILLYVGFSTPRKGVEYLAHALNLMKNSCYLVMVGQWENNYQKKFVKTLGRNIAKTKMVGYVPDKDLPLFYAAADVFVFPTLLEGFGFPLVEAMASGLPIVTTWGGSASEVVGEGGLVVRPGDALALAEALDQVLDNPDLARHLAEAGRYRAHTLFSNRRAINEIERLYYRVLNENIPNVQ